jgi:hypothetical protein
MEIEGAAQVGTKLKVHMGVTNPDLVSAIVEIDPFAD